LRAKWQKCDPKLIGCHLLSGGEKLIASAKAIDYQFVSQKLFRAITLRRCPLMGVLRVTAQKFSPIIHFGRINNGPKTLTSIECRVVNYASELVQHTGASLNGSKQ
jgi:hypothetical protein